MVFDREPSGTARDFMRRVMLGLAVAMLANLAVIGVFVVREVRGSIAQQRTAQLRAALPDTADFLYVTHADLRRDDAGALVVCTDAHAVQPFTGRYKVALRDAASRRHVFSPKWSDWIEYAANPDGTRYRQPETLGWWAGRDREIGPIDTALDMQTCWQAQYQHPDLGVENLTPVCVRSSLGPARETPNPEPFSCSPN